MANEPTLEVLTAGRCPAGYHWRAGSREGKFESVGDAGGSGEAAETAPLRLVTLSDEVERYQPPDDLFLRLAQVERTPAAVLEFANQFGLLGAHPLAEELFLTWKDTIAYLRSAVALYGALRDHAAGDSERLRQLVRWTAQDCVEYVGPGFQLPIAAPYASPERLKRFRQGDLVEPARYYLQELVNDGLEGCVDPKLLWNLERTRLALHLVPDSLEGCVWLQLAHTIDGAKLYRQCRNCGRWMMISREQAGNRPSRHTCSNACRMQVYLKRQAEAARLHQQGMPVAEIAPRLETEARIVKRWIDKKRGAGTGRKRKGDNNYGT